MQSAAGLQLHDRTWHASCISFRRTGPWLPWLRYISLSAGPGCLAPRAQPAPRGGGAAHGAVPRPRPRPRGPAEAEAAGTAAAVDEQPLSPLCLRRTSSANRSATWSSRVSSRQRSEAGLQIKILKGRQVTRGFTIQFDRSVSGVSRTGITRSSC